MTTGTVDWIADFLATGDEFFVPVKKLWLIAQGNRLATDLPLEEFRRLLEEDGRFAFDEGIDFGEGFGDPESERGVMESLGDFSGPQVRLEAREITLDMIAMAIKRSTDRLMAVLESAWEARDPEDGDVETRLLDLLAQGQRLRRGMEETFGDLSEREGTEEAG